MILIGKNLELKVIHKVICQRGRFIILLCEIQGKSFLLINSYAPNDEASQVNFLREIYEKIREFETPDDTRIIWGGDFNFTFNLEFEALGGKPTKKILSVETMETIMNDIQVCDIWRIRNQNCKRFTWSGTRINDQNQTQSIFRRLDYFFVSSSLQPNVVNCDIIPAPNSDHSALTLDINTSEEEITHGPSYWKFNNSLLDDDKYIAYLKQELRKLQSDINQCFPEEGARIKWDFLKYKIRSITMSYSKQKAREFREDIQYLEQEIKNIEEQLNWENIVELSEKHDSLKKSLDIKYAYITKGIILRSHTLWYEEGEKNTKYFLSLEKCNSNKTHLRKILNDQGEEISDAKLILRELRTYYESLYRSKNNTTEEECLDFIKNIHVQKLSPERAQKCEGKLSLQECFDSLTQMANPQEMMDLRNNFILISGFFLERVW